MAAAPQPDLSAAALESFLLTRYVEILQDEGRSAEERLEMQMALESFVLSYGKKMLTQISRPLAVADNFAAVSLYVGFASSLDAGWLEEVDTELLARIWRTYDDRMYRRRALELMVKKEWVSDPAGNSARDSRAVQLFQDLQGNHSVREELHPDAKELLELLLRRANLTDPKTIRAGRSLGTYCLQIARFCFDETSTSISEENIRALLTICPELDETQSSAAADILRLTRIA